MVPAREKILIPAGHSFRVLRWERSLRDVECLLSPGKGTRIVGEGAHWHFHQEMELTLFSSGEGTRFVGDHIGSFAEGDLVLLGEKLPHYWHTRGASTGISIQWHFPESHPLWAFPENLELHPFFKRADHGLHVTGRTAATATALMHELTRSRDSSQLACLLRIISLLAHAPSADLRSLSARSFSLSAQSHYEKAIAKSVQYLIAHYRDEVRLEDLMRVSGLSRPTFARQFKQHSGRSFSEFLNNLRIQAACRELKQSNRSVLDIALASGFNQLSFFNRLFRRLKKCTPTEYRGQFVK